MDITRAVCGATCGSSQGCASDDRGAGQIHSGVCGRGHGLDHLPRGRRRRTPSSSSARSSGKANSQASRSIPQPRWRRWSTISIRSISCFWSRCVGFGGQKFIDAVDEKIKRLAKMRKAKGLSFEIQVDGGINTTNGVQKRALGVDNLRRRLDDLSIEGHQRNRSPLKSVIA